MKRRAILSTVAVAAALILGLALTPSANAQVNPGAQGNFGGRGQGRFGGAGMFRQRGQMFFDPAVSHESELLRRTDVRRELMLSGRQQEQLNDVLQKSQADMAQQRREAFQQMRQQRQQSGPNLDPQDRQAYRQQMQEQMQAQMATIQASQDKQLEAVLTSGQVARLHQLDLQWRGAMALSDPKLADKVGLEPDQRTQITQILQSFRTAQGQAMRSVFQGAFGRRTLPPNNVQGGANATPNTPNAQGNPGGPPAFDPAAVQERIQEAQKQVDKTRKEDDGKVQALLTPAQKQQWLTMQGKPFYFDPKVTNDLMNNPQNSGQ